MALVDAQVDKIILDTGIVYINGSMIAPCEGDNTYVVDREYRDIPYNGMAAKTRGLKRILRENVTLTVHPKGLTQEMLLHALPGATYTDGKIQIMGSRQVIADSEYLDEVTLVGDTKDGHTKVITLYRCLADNGLSLTMGEDGEAILELAFSAHKDASNLNLKLSEVEDVADYY